MPVNDKFPLNPAVLGSEHDVWRALSGERAVSTWVSEEREEHWRKDKPNSDERGRTPTTLDMP